MLRSVIFIFDLSVVKSIWDLYVFEMDNRDSVFYTYIVSRLSEMYGLTININTKTRISKLPSKLFTRDKVEDVDRAVFEYVKIPAFDNCPPTCDVDIRDNDLFVYFH
jgi:hypothetical protein